MHTYVTIQLALTFRHPGNWLMFLCGINVYRSPDPSSDARQARHRGDLEVAIDAQILGAPSVPAHGWGSVLYRAVVLREGEREDLVWGWHAITSPSTARAYVGNIEKSKNKNTHSVDNNDRVPILNDVQWCRQRRQSGDISSEQDV